MNKFLTIAVAVAVCATVSQAQLVMYDDFESYAVNSSIHLQGIDVAGVPRWYAQQNSSALADSGLANVRSFGGNKVLEIASDLQEGYEGGYTTSGAAMAMKSREILGLGTIYLRWSVNDDGAAPLTMTNDLNPGWDYASAATVDPGLISADGWQEGYGGDGYKFMGAMVKTGGGINFNARNQGGAGGYQDDIVPTPLLANAWQELWIQVDSPGDRAMYYICPQGGVPTQMTNPGVDGIAGNADDSVWWNHRNEGHDNDSVANLKWIVSNWGAAETDWTRNALYLDTIAVDVQAHTLDRVGQDAPLPEPATMSLLALGGLAMLRRRR